ncbi:Putative von Willebrand factor, vWF type A domain protein STM2315 [hydrothermal vent metagenome]|uniref:von Willebrand factor, vWF type A domain protein STM2315 n=1 Tax=hydrothermal vent metagenome TaxID=652676 RepID=A0A3B0Z7S4_9ZZZZ
MHVINFKSLLVKGTIISTIMAGLLACGQKPKISELPDSRPRGSVLGGMIGVTSSDSIRGASEKRPYVSTDDIPVTSHARNPEMYFRHYGVNPTIDTAVNNVSTFSVDVDTASYSIARAFLLRGALPDPAGIRVEEFVNTFNYHYRAPKHRDFNFHAEAFPSPNRRGYHLLHIGLQGRRISRWKRKPANLVYLIDVSGSMQGRQRLGMLKRAIHKLTNQLRPNDMVSIVAFNNRASVILSPTLAKHSGQIRRSVNNLHASGSTNVQAGLNLAYSLARQNHKRYSTNRIILISDGVANTGLTTASDIFETIYKGNRQGIQLNTVGIGMGKYNDVLLEKLAKKGQGFYAYINNMRDAKKIFVKQLVGTLQLLARDVKIQVEFNPNRVARYRLLGYENRLLKKRDFRNDNKDAAEMGAGHAVTAIYEIKLRRGRGHFGTIRLRFKHAKKETVREVSKQLPMSIIRRHYAQVSSYTKLAYISATFAEKLRQSYWVRNISYPQLINLYHQLSPRVKNTSSVSELGHLLKIASQLDNRIDKFSARTPIAEMSFDQVPVLE